MNQSCSKVGYNSKKDATTMINSIMGGHRKHRPKKLRSYYCQKCKAHHLTSS